VHALRLAALTALGSFALLGSSISTPTSGVLYYTLITGHPDVMQVSYSYDAMGHFVLGTPTGVADASPSADGLIFAPNGDLLVGGQHSDQVYQYTTGGAYVASPSTDATSPEASFHLFYDSTRNAVFTSDTYDGFGTGALSVLPFDGAGILQTGTKYSVGGDDHGVTSLVDAGSYGWFYIKDDGNPNGKGNFGSVDLSSLSSITTTRLYSSVNSAHSMTWDAFTNRITMFGGGYVGTWDPSNPTAGPVESSQITCDFDQGAVDGQGHALIAGCNQITFIDYSATGDITSSLNFVSVVGGFNQIDDVAPLSGPGSHTGTPEPQAVTLALGGLLMLAGLRRRFRRV